MQPRVGLDVWTDYKTQQSPWSGKRGTILTHNIPDDVRFDASHSPQVLRCCLRRGGGNGGAIELKCQPFHSANKNAHTALAPRSLRGRNCVPRTCEMSIACTDTATFWPGLLN